MEELKREKHITLVMKK